MPRSTTVPRPWSRRCTRPYVWGNTADSIFLLLGSLYPQDLAVVQTLLAGTQLTYDIVPIDPRTGTVALAAVQQAAMQGNAIAGIAFPQVNSVGCLEDVDRLTDLAHSLEAQAIVVTDPMLLATGGLKAPGRFGQAGQGADILVGEAQHLAIAPNYGGPGLGVFGVRANAAHRQDMRQAPGRFVGQARDTAGHPAKVLVLSTREQHIRRHRATSNICTNQAFVATLAGAAILARGEHGMQEACAASHANARAAAQALLRLPGVHLAFAQTPFWNTFVVTLPRPSLEVIEAARQHGLHLGVDVSSRIPGSTGQHLLLSCCRPSHSTRRSARLQTCGRPDSGRQLRAMSRSRYRQYQPSIGGLCPSGCRSGMSRLCGRPLLPCQNRTSALTAPVIPSAPVP